MIEKCPVCGSTRSLEIVHRANVPVLMNRLHPTRESARLASTGTLDIRGCEECGFAWNTVFDPEVMTYDGEYENDQTHSSHFTAHINKRADDILAAVSDDNMVDYLELGCGQGTFVGKVARVAGSRLRSASGFDPAWRGSDTRGPCGSLIHKVYFNEDTARLLTRQPNVVASRHTIEHIPDPLSFLRSLRAALGPTSQARVFIETPCIAWILEHEAMQDFFYEHCSIFSHRALHYALEASGFRVRRIIRVFGGQYLWAEGQAGTGIVPTRPSTSVARNLAGAQKRFTTQWRTAAEDARAAGAVSIWGAGAKGVMFAVLADPDGVLLDHAVDINPSKQGSYLAGSGLPVLAPAQAAERHPQTIFIMNPNYMSEIRESASASRIDARLVAI
jgi:hypothetical protein